MTFYLRPPSGVTQYDRLEKLAITRLNFLLRLESTNGDAIKVHDLFTDISLVEESDCLIEGTRKDRISHFILRLAFSYKPELQKFIKKAESLLFEVRFLNSEEKSLCKLLHSLDHVLLESKHLGLKNCDVPGTDDPEVLEIFCAFRKMLKDFDSWEELIELYFSGCQTEFIEIPFTFVPDLVKSRAVTLTCGMAYVCIAKLRLVVMAMFDTLLSSGLRKASMNYRFVVADGRMRKLFAKLQEIFYTKVQRSVGEVSPSRRLSHAGVDAEVEFFPLCMSHLHSTLRENHRLRHHSRIQYTLFLKEIGMPVHEAIMFWKQEYSLVSGGNKSCCHSWKTEENRYTYNIRHLYGLEGSRTNYRGHSCNSLQHTDFGHSEEGGCPFVRFDAQHLTKLLESDVSQTSLDKILKSVSKGDYQGACQTFLTSKTVKEVLREQFEDKTFQQTWCKQKLHVHLVNGLQKGVPTCNTEMTNFPKSVNIGEERTAEFSQNRIVKPLDFYTEAVLLTEI